MSDLIIVDIAEKENIIIDGSLELKAINGNGKLTIKNPSNKSRLWNLTANLKEIVNTTISSRDLSIGILNPADEFKIDYDIHNLKEQSLKIVEIFDTEKSISDKVNNVFLSDDDNNCKLRLILNNPLDISISNIKLTREIPSFFQNIEIKNPNLGVAGIREESGNRKLSWDIVSLEGKQRTELEVSCVVNVKDKNSKSLGALNITYLINNYKLTLINPEVRGLTDSMSGIDRDESSQPGIWNCSVDFINESEFQVRLENVKVQHRITTGTEMVVSQAPSRLLNPDQSWNFGFQVESKNVPELTSSIEFTPLFVVITRVIGEINKEPTIYNVLSATIEKKIEPTEVDAYANTDMRIINTIVNNGSSNIESLKLFDKIPIDFIPPLLDHVKIKMGDIDISARADFTKKIVLDPDNQNPDSEHRLNIDLFNLKNDFIPNSAIKISYPLKARNPRPPAETLYKTPVSIEVNSPIEGKAFLKAPDQEPEIIVRYVKRKLKTLKSIKPGMSEGEFSITIRIQNKGTVELENIIIKEKIPKGFELSEIEIENYQIVNLGEEVELHVQVPILRGNEAINLNYNCSGQGEYPRLEPEVIVQDRESSENLSSPKTLAQPFTDAVTILSPEKKATINDLFITIFKKVEQTITGDELFNFIENVRYQFPPGPILHQFMQFAKDIKNKNSDKLIVGPLRDEILEKLNTFKEKYN
ncbi:MAG: hypothetical protein ACFFD5_11695 [Candidatus Thorarchaeota archaeon]